MKKNAWKERRHMTMQEKIRKDIPVALYFQIKEEVRRKILSNEWPEGSKIPSEKEMSKFFGVSRITVKKALDELQTEDLVVRKQGRGTFVKSCSIGQELSKFYSFSEQLGRLGIKETVKLIQFQEMVPGLSIRNGLQLEPEERVFWVKRIRYMDQKAYTIENSYIPVKFVPELTGELIQNNGLYKSLEMFQIFPQRAIETFSAVNISKEEAHDMDLRVNDAAISLIRITYSGASIVEYCVSVVRGDVFHYTVELK